MATAVSSASGNAPVRRLPKSDSAVSADRLPRAAGKEDENELNPRFLHEQGIQRPRGGSTGARARAQRLQRGEACQRGGQGARK